MRFLSPLSFLLVLPETACFGLSSTRIPGGQGLTRLESSLSTTPTEDLKGKEDDGRSDVFVKTFVDYFAQDLDEPKRANIQAVPGYGKTYLAWKVMEGVLPRVHDPASDSGRKSESKIAVYVTPYLHLIDQALSNREDHRLMMTKIDPSHTIKTMIVSSNTSRKKERCSTNVNEIADFLSESSERDGETWNILVCTYHSLHKVSKALDCNNIHGIDFAVFDEAHRMEGADSRFGDPKKKEKGYSYGLYDSNIEIRNRLFMTGTPNNYTQDTKIIKVLPSPVKSNGEIIFIPQSKDSSAKIRSFGDESLFGPCLANKSHRESVEEKTTLPISLYFADTRVFHKYSEDGSWNPETEKDHFLAVAIRSAYHKLKVKHAVSFHSTNLRAKRFMNTMQDEKSNSNISVFHMNHTMSAAKRKQILSGAKASAKSLITNCKLLSMGVDWPSLELVVIADPVKSAVGGRQMIGRIGRKAQGKERGYVLVPVPIKDEDGTLDRDCQAYEILVNTFNHMVNLDRELCRDLILVIEKSSKEGRPLELSEYPKRIKDAFIFPPSIPLTLQLELMDRAIVEYKGNSTSKWENMYSLLVQYNKREGHSNVSYSHKEDGANLGTWLCAQRQLKAKGSLDTIRVNRLEAINVVWDPFSQQWEDMYSLLVQYNKREGHSNVSYSHKEDGANLGYWLKTQRQLKAKGSLDTIRVNRLEAIGVVWDPISQQWEDMYSLLVQYNKREGHSNVVQNHKEDGANLGTWLYTQRTLKTKGSLDSIRANRLEAIGVVWDPISQQWEHMYSLLVQYNKREGHSNVSYSHKEDGANLGTWLCAQRQLKAKGSLDTIRVNRLEAINVVWDPFSQQWEDMYSLLVQYNKREGHSNVSYSHKEDGANLGYWLKTQRQLKAKGSLDTIRVNRLEAIGVVWDPISQQWEDMYSLLVQYNKREGHSNVVQNHKEDGANLGTWLAKQRTLKTKGSLDSIRANRLEAIGVVWDPFSQQWEDMYSLLVQYNKREGHSNVSYSHKEDGANLGTWLDTQRTLKAKGSLDSIRVNRLEAIGVVLDPFSQQWEDMYSLLVQYNKREGHSNVPSRHKEDGANLGSWLQTQRTLKAKESLDSIRANRLEAIGVVWDPLSQRWEHMYSLLVHYNKREGHSNVPQNHKEDGANLGTWLAKQRTLKTKGSLDSIRANRLEAIGVVLDPFSQQWEDMYSLLVQYNKREGHSNVPQNHKEDGANLGPWLNTQREAKKNRKLKLDRVRRLTQLGVVWSFRRY